MSRICRRAVALALAAAAGSVAAQGLRLPGDALNGMGQLPDAPDIPQPGGSLMQPGSPPQTSPGPMLTPSPSPAPSGRRIENGDSIVAVVNSEAITRLELDARVQAARATLARQNIPLPDDRTIERQVLERMIVERTQLQEAAQSGIKIDDFTLDRAISRIAEDNKVTVSQMRDQIERSGLPFSAYREDLRNEITLVRLRERQVDSQVHVSESEIDAYLAEQHETAPPQLTLAQILVRVPDGTPSDQVATLRRKADLLLEQARGGADFARLAAASSDGEEALHGGDLGTRPADRWPSLFVDAVANLSPGGISGVIQSGNGFHIIKLVDRKAGGNAPDTGAMPVQQTHARHILIRTSEVMTSDQARDRLANIRQRIVEGGVSFADMARQYSNDASAPQGGDLGWLSPNETVPEFEHAMDALKPGEISQPVQSPFGWHLIMVEGRRTQDVARDRQRAAARQALFQRKVDQAYEDWARQLRDRAYVENRLDSEAGPAARNN
ncbi:peptidylprolyl isomerase [Pigmentiphaga soli]